MLSTVLWAILDSLWICLFAVITHAQYDRLTCCLNSFCCECGYLMKTVIIVCVVLGFL